MVEKGDQNEGDKVDTQEDKVDNEVPNRLAIGDVDKTRKSVLNIMMEQSNTKELEAIDDLKTKQQEEIIEKSFD